jgi:large subunit ribosomal protein L2
MSVIDYSSLSDVKPMKRSRRRLKSPAGRNNRGRITVRHQGGGVKRLYRDIDFRQAKINVPGRVETLEYDPYRSAFIVSVLYKDGDRRYHLAPEGLKVGDPMLIAEKAELKVGNRLPLKNIPVGYNVHNIEINPGRGGQIIRSAGSQAQIMAQGSGYTDLKMPSGEVRRVMWTNFASIGQVSNPDHILVSIGKAGRNRMKGIRPTVRGSVMNPVDHPYGGGEGKQPRGTKRPKTRWGKVTGGHKTRKKKKYSARLIVSRRVNKKRKK